MHYTYIIYYIDSVYTYVVFVQIDKYIYMGVCTCTDTHRCTLGHLYYYCLTLVLNWSWLGVISVFCFKRVHYAHWAHNPQLSMSLFFYIT